MREKITMIRSTHKNILIFAMVVWFLPAGIRAQSTDYFREGKVYVDFLGSVVSEPGPPSFFTHADFTLDLLYPYAFVFGVPNAVQLQTRNLALIDYYLQTQKTEAISNNVRIGAEYALTDWFGIGATYRQTNVSIKNATAYDFADPSLNLFVGLLQSTTTVPYYYYLPLIKGTYALPAFKLVLFDMSFHIYKSGRFDPYFRLSFGGGTSGKATSSVTIVHPYSVSLTWGARVGIGNNIHATLEQFYDYYSFKTSFSGAFSGVSSALHFNDVGLRIGVGFAMNAP